MPSRSRSSVAHQDRWLISYADLITLLFAVFVVLFASSYADGSKARRVSVSVQNAFAFPQTGASGVARDTPAKFSGDRSLESALGVLSHGLQLEIGSGKMRIAMERRGIVVSLSQASFFPSGEDAVDPAMSNSLGKVAGVIDHLPNLVRFEGHTDSLPIHTPRFRSNWDLSSARAIAMMRLLHDRWHIASDRLAVTGYADTIPIDSNDTEIGRARNRRVDIVILSEGGAKREPGVQP